jgi:hypothetical protein
MVEDLLEYLKEKHGITPEKKVRHQ